MDIESSTSGSSTSDEDETSDQEDMDVSEMPANEALLTLLQEGDSQALVPMRPDASVTVGQVTEGTVSLYRGVSRTAGASLPHFRVVPALSSAGQAGIVRAGGAASSSVPQLPYHNVRAITAGTEVAKFVSQVSVESNASDSSLSVAAIQYDGASGEHAEERVYIHESIVSLLLRLHSRFNGNTDSYHLPDVSTELSESDPQSLPSTSTTLPRHSTSIDDSRIGDGTFWIGKVLDKLSKLDPRVRQCIQSTRMALWPPRPTDSLLDETPDEVKEKEKKRKIRERQQRLLQEFATKQKQFMQQAMAEDMDTDQDMGTGTSAGGNAEGTSADSSFAASEETVVEEYDCVICNQASASTSTRPICLVVLLQATSVLAHRRHHGGGGGLSLPVSDEDRLNLNKVDTLSVEMERRVENLRQHFNESSWLQSLNIGYEGGVYVHTCGHYLHLDCHKQYLQSLRSQQRQQSLNVERGEYSCPLCRQLANSVLPIATQLIAKKPLASRGALTTNQDNISEEIYTMFNAEPSLQAGSNLMEAMGRVMEDMTNATYPRFRQITPTPSPASLFLFVQSIARTNLEIELLQRGDTITRNSATSQVATSGSSPTPPGTSSASWNSPGLELRFSSSPTPGSSTGTSSAMQPWSLLPKRSCMLPLLHVLATHSKILTVRAYSQLWSQISGLHLPMEGGDPHSPQAASVSRCETDVPLLIQDVSCLLLQMILVLPLPLERRHFTCLIQRLFNVAAVQIAAQLTCQLGEKKRKLYKMLTASEWNLAALMSCVVGFLDDSHLYMEEEEENGRDHKTLNVEADVQQPLYRMALQFLRLAALLLHHMFGDPLPGSAVSNTDYEEFVELCSYLSISYEPKFDASLNPRVVIRSWCDEFRVFLSRSPLISRSLLLQYRPWRRPRLLALPHSYDTLFQVSYD